MASEWPLDGLLRTPLIASLIRYIRSFGRGLAANKTLTQLNVSSNKLLPEGIKVVCSDDLCWFSDGL